MDISEALELTDAAQRRLEHDQIEMLSWTGEMVRSKLLKLACLASLAASSQRMHMDTAHTILHLHIHMHKLCICTPCCHMRVCVCACACVSVHVIHMHMHT